MADDDVMPVFVIKACDNLAEPVIRAYAEACDGLWDQDQAFEVRLALAEIKAWRKRNPSANGRITLMYPAGQRGSGSERR